MNDYREVILLATEVKSGMTTIQTDESQPRDRTILLTTCLVVFAMIANSTGVLIFSNMNFGPTSHFINSLLCLAIGMLIAEPCLLAAWATLSPQKLKHRIPWSFGILLFLTIIYLCSLEFVSEGRSDQEAYFVFFGISIGLYLLAVIPVSVFRWKSRHTLSKQETGIDPDQPIQFGIRHILVLMALVPVGVSIGQYLFENLGFDRDTPWLEILTFIALHSMLVWVAFLLGIACVFAKKRVAYFVCLLVYLAVVPTVVVGILSYCFINFRPLEVQSCVQGVCFATGFACVIIATMQMYRSIGYRLRAISGS